MPLSPEINALGPIGPVVLLVLLGLALYAPITAVGIRFWRSR